MTARTPLRSHLGGRLAALFLVVAGIASAAPPIRGLPDAVNLIGAGAPTPAAPAWKVAGQEATGAIGNLAMSPDGATVFATGAWYRGNVHYALVTAYAVDTGAIRWQFRSTRESVLRAIAVAPNGSWLVVVGEVAVRDEPDPVQGVWVLDAKTGANRWSASYAPDDDDANRNSDRANDVVIAPAGDRLFVVGTAWISRSRKDDLVVAAYEARLGRLLWRRTAGLSARRDVGEAIAVSPAGTTVVATGYRGRVLGGFHAELIVLALNASTGAKRWVVVREPAPTGEQVRHQGHDLEIRAGSVFVSGLSQYARIPNARDVLIRQRLDDGSRLWKRRFHANPQPFAATELFVDVTGAYVAGTHVEGQTFRVWSHALQGARRWISTDLGAGEVSDLAAMPGSGPIYVAGSLRRADHTRELVIAGFARNSGALVWRGGVDTSEGSSTAAFATVLTPDGTRLIAGGLEDQHALLVAYNLA